jgi:hypothetical protein
MSGKASGFNTATKLDPSDCETLDIGLEGFEECPCTGPNSCRYALPFGYGFLCQHPRFAETERAPATEDMPTRR